MGIHALSQNESAADQIEWVQITGWPNDLLRTISHRIEAFGKHGGYHRKIGITNNPLRRWRQSYRYNGWYRMHVLYESSSREHVKDMERLVTQKIDDGLFFGGGYFYNETGGGGGRPSEFGPHYLYLVVAPRWSTITANP